MDPAHENATSMPKSTALESQTEKHDDEGDLLKLGNEPKIEKEASSPSSSSDTSSDEDFFQFEATEHSNSRPPLPQLGNRGSIAGVGSPELPIGSPFSPDTNSAKQSPPVQVMGRFDVPDPNRIPSSVFARTNTTTTPMEWSMASNESLFSIHMGNSSFSRDHVFLLGKSQELGNFSSSMLDGPPPTLPSAPSPPPVPAQALEAPNEAPNMNDAADKERNSSDKERNSSDKERTSAVSAVAPRSTSTSRLSDGSVCSFAFPILTGEGRDGSIKVGPEHQPTQPEQPQKPQLEAETPKAVPAAAGNKLFPCFSCCPFCS